MFDQDEGHSLFVTDPAEQGIKFCKSVDAEANRWLIEQYHLWVSDQRSCDFDHALLPEGKC